MNMNLETLLQSLPSREDLASAVGLESRRSSWMPSMSSSSMDVMPALTLFGTGMLFGAGLALLFAPKSGQEMRKDLGRTMEQYGYGEGQHQGRGYGERQMASQGSQSLETSRYSSQQDYPRQMSGQTSSEQSRQMSGTQHNPGQSSSTPGSRQMSGHQSEQRSESELSRTRTPGTGSRNI